MSNGVDRRAQIDTELVKGLLLLNGGGAVALLTLMPRIIGESRFEPLSHAILLALLSFHVGLVFAVVHTRFRRICSLVYEANQMRPTPGRLFGLTLREPTVCMFSIWFMWGSLALFILGGLLVFFGGLDTL